MTKARKPRGSLWVKKGSKKQYRGSYSIYKGDRHFILTPVLGGKTTRYEAPVVAVHEGWKKL